MRGREERRGWEGVGRGGGWGGREGEMEGWGLKTGLHLTFFALMILTLDVEYCALVNFTRMFKNKFI